MGCKIGICSSSLTASLCVDLSLRPVKAFSMRRKGNVHDPRWRLTPMSKASTGYSQRGDATPREAEKWLLDGDATHTRADLLKEQGRRYERELATFTFDRWASHRSTARYIRHMLGIFQSSIFRALAQPLLSVATISTAVCTYETMLSDGALPTYMPSLLMPTDPFNLTSFALSLLLVFRTNTSYDRWLEVRTTWGGMTNRARDTMRQLISHLSDSSGAIHPLAAAMSRWVVAFARSLKDELTEGGDLRAELAEVLTPEELTQLMDAHHRPSFALSVLTELGAAAPLRESHRIRLDENLTYFEDAVGCCERIIKTPIPLSYTRHTSRFMVTWLSALPLGLYSTCGWATIPLVCTIAFLLLGIDEIGVQIEEPFGLLPLDDMCAQIEMDLFSMVKESVATKRTASAAAAAALGQLSLGEGNTAPFSPLPTTGRSKTTVRAWGSAAGGVQQGATGNLFGAWGAHPEWDEVAGRSASLDEVMSSRDDEGL